MKQNKSGNGEFKKEIGLFGGMSVICGIMIGSGIFYLGSYVLQRSGYSLGLALICWLLGGLVSLLGGLCFAELGVYTVDTGQLRLYRGHRGRHPYGPCGLYPGTYTVPYKGDRHRTDRAPDPL